MFQDHLDKYLIIKDICTCVLHFLINEFMLVHCKFGTSLSTMRKIVTITSTLRKTYYLPLNHCLPKLHARGLNTFSTMEFNWCQDLAFWGMTRELKGGLSLQPHSEHCSHVHAWPCTPSIQNLSQQGWFTRLPWMIPSIWAADILKEEDGCSSFHKEHFSDFLGNTMVKYLATF